MFLFRDFSLKETKEIRASLLEIFGVGWCKSKMIINRIGLAYPFFSNNLNYYLIKIILFLLKGVIFSDSKIKRIIANNINNLLINNSYRGIRHKLTLPVRGQRSRTNSATQRSKRLI